MRTMQSLSLVIFATLALGIGATMAQSTTGSTNQNTPSNATANNAADNQNGSSAPPAPALAPRKTEGDGAEGGAKK